MADSVTPVPPEVWFKTQRALRTVFAFLVVAIPLLNSIAAGTIEYLREQENVPVPGWVFLALNGIIGVTALLLGLFNRWMQTPGFNELLTRIGLGTVPKSNLQLAADGAGNVETVVVPDPHAVYVPGVTLRRDLNDGEGQV